MSDKTIFEKILLGEIPAKKVYEDEFSLAFYDVNPQAPVHVLVIPKEKSQNFSQLGGKSPELVGQFMQSITKVIDKLDLDEKGYRLVFNTGDYGGQTVNYLHAHILSGRHLGWPPG